MPKAKAEKTEPQSASKAAVKEEKVKRERKTYELPGQTRETPIEVRYMPAGSETLLAVKATAKATQLLACVCAERLPTQVLHLPS